MLVAIAYDTLYLIAFHVFPCAIGLSCEMGADLMQILSNSKSRCQLKTWCLSDKTITDCIETRPLHIETVKKPSYDLGDATGFQIYPIKFGFSEEFLPFCKLMKSCILKLTAKRAFDTFFNFQID